jgi:hypothetical protein
MFYTAFLFTNAPVISTWKETCKLSNVPGVWFISLAVYWILHLSSSQVFILLGHNLIITCPQRQEVERGFESDERAWQIIAALHPRSAQLPVQFPPSDRSTTAVWCSAVVINPRVTTRNKDISSSSEIMCANCDSLWGRRLQFQPTGWGELSLFMIWLTVLICCKRWWCQS